MCYFEILTTTYTPSVTRNTHNVSKWVSAKWCASVCVRVCLCIFINLDSRIMWANGVWVCARLSLRDVLLCYNTMMWLCVWFNVFVLVGSVHTFVLLSTTFRMCVVFFSISCVLGSLLWGTYVSSVSNTKYVVRNVDMKFFGELTY